jgi:hypothetical protein
LLKAGLAPNASNCCVVTKWRDVLLAIVRNNQRRYSITSSAIS